MWVMPKLFQEGGDGLFVCYVSVYQIGMWLDSQWLSFLGIQFGALYVGL